MEKAKREEGDALEGVEGPHPRDDLILLPQGAFTWGAGGTAFCTGSIHTPDQQKAGECTSEGL